MPQAATGTGGLAGLLGSGATTGRITAIEGQTVTVQTPQGSIKVNLGAAATVDTVQTGAAESLKEGMSILASGARKDDGTFEASSITQLPNELAALLGGGGRAAGAPGSR
jgi:hypothetical protein